MPPDTRISLSDSLTDIKQIMECIYQYPRTYWLMQDTVTERQAHHPRICDLCRKVAKSVLLDSPDMVEADLKTLATVGGIAVALEQLNVNDERRQRFFARPLEYWISRKCTAENRAFFKGLWQQFGSIDPPEGR
jgi:hypothetical protein